MKKVDMYYKIRSYSSHT